MKTKLALLFVVFLSSLPVYTQDARGQQAPSTARKAAAPQPAPAKPSSKPAQTQAKKTDATTTPQEAKPEPGPVELITQGKSFYRSARFKQALAKFEAALKQEPENDEALGLAAVTAFRLDNQEQSRGYFLQRAELPDQKDSVKAFCYYRVALTYWRDAHDLVAKYGETNEGQLAYNLPERDASIVGLSITSGLENVDRALAITDSFAEAYNIKNLLHAEASLAEKDEESAKEHRRESVESLRRAIELSKLSSDPKRGEAADFSRPTARIAQYTLTREEEEQLDDPLMKMLAGGRPTKRVKPSFPGVRPPKPSIDQNDPSSKGTTQEGGAYSPGTVKVEVLVSTTGEVVFAHIIHGRSGHNGAAILAARSWRFEPAKFEGNPVQVSGVVTFNIRP